MQRRPTADDEQVKSLRRAESRYRAGDHRDRPLRSGASSLARRVGTAAVLGIIKGMATAAGGAVTGALIWWLSHQ